MVQQDTARNRMSTPFQLEAAGGRRHYRRRVGDHDGALWRHEAGRRAQLGILQATKGEC